MNASNFPLWRACIDSGGTYTSACLLSEDGEIYSVKVPTLPGSPSASAEEALTSLIEKTGLAPGSLCYIIYCTTLALNPVLQGLATKTAILTTRGFGDILLAGIQQTLILPGPTLQRLPFRRRLIFEIEERMLPGGGTFTPLAENELRGLVPRLRDEGIESVAICFLHSYVNPIHEQKARDILAEAMPGLPVTISSEVLPFPGESFRAAATALSAMVRPQLESCIVATYDRIKNWPGKSPGFMVSQSDGSTADVLSSCLVAAGAILSGPAGGVASASLLSAKTGRPNLITLEIGGSSTNISIIQRDKPSLYSGNKAPVSSQAGLPSLNIHSLGAGGGSIAALDANGSIRVGPLSAGSHPGPACCGGSLPTCTDANVLLGRINPDAIITGGPPASAGAALNSIKASLAGPLGISAEEAARRIIASLNSNIIQALRAIIDKNGLDPREYTLVSYGGAGPQHAAEIARECGIHYVLVPREPGFYSAQGALSTVRRSYEAVTFINLEEADPDRIFESYAELEKTALDDFAAQGINASRIIIERTADLRFMDQLLELNMQFPAGRLKKADLSLLGRAFVISFSSAYGFTPDDTGTEIVRLRLTAALDTPNRPSCPGKLTINGLKPALYRKAVFGDDTLDTPVYSRNELYPSASLRGPLIIEQEGTSTLVWPGMSASVDARGNIIISVEVL
ncbi:MAG: hypothetical protein JL50_03290 [Peptococcaceae bacterium BICA1-7]|nr:MAG: hypothetical protein JL50_03290 [Peptococcaceae bacterium BICA1-7]HBV97710.1 5-oxoprolinase [Desulfotomaculum sp.]